MTRPAQPEPALFTHWERTVGEILDRTMKFPRSVRFTFTSRIDNAALDILERIVDARYARASETEPHLRDADARLTRLRVLLRLSTDRGYLSRRAYGHLMHRIDEAGRMLGGWRAATRKT